LAGEAVVVIGTHPPDKVKPRWRVVVVDDHAPSKVAVAEAVNAMGGSTSACFMFIFLRCESRSEGQEIRRQRHAMGL